MTDSKIDIQAAVSAIVQEKIRGAVVEALAKDPGPMIERIIDMALNEKPRDSFRSETIWQREVHKMIRDEAIKAVAEWTEEQRPAIRAAVRKRLGQRGTKIVNELVDKLGTELTNVRVDLKIGSGSDY